MTFFYLLVYTVIKQELNANVSVKMLFVNKLNNLFMD
jgi:hypothetical protein